MNSQNHIHTLRVQLLAMSRLTQRALDYSIKGYETGNLDFSRQVSACQCALEEHHRRIKELCREAVNAGIPNASDFRFAFSTLTIAAALHTTYSAAAEIAQSTVRHFEDSGVGRRTALGRMGDFVNASMRLSVIALFEENAGHAHTVLQSQEQSVELLQSCSFESDTDRRLDPQVDFERTVIRALEEVVRQVREIGHALLFWLEGNVMTAVSPANDIERFAFEVASARREHDAIVCIPSRRDFNAKHSPRLSC
jgi:hypothetical protein